jgi:hypothetical protein
MDNKKTSYYFDVNVTFYRAVGKFDLIFRISNDSSIRSKSGMSLVQGKL